MSPGRLVGALGGVLLTAGVAHAERPRLPAYELGFRVQAVPGRAQVRSGRLAPLSVEIHNNGDGAGRVEIECRVGGHTVTGAVQARAIYQTVFLTLPEGTPIDDSPRGPQRVSCHARPAGFEGPSIPGEAHVRVELSLEAPVLPDHVLTQREDTPFRGAFDCESLAPPIATRSTCVELTSLDRAGTVAAGAPDVRCVMDGAALTRRPGPYHDGPFELGLVPAGRHVLRCTATAASPALEADRTNDTLELAFDVGDGSEWRYDLAIRSIEPAARAAQVVSRRPGPTNDTPAPRVPGLVFTVGVENVGRMRVFAVEVSCEARRGGRTTNFDGVWARPGGRRDGWLRGLDPGEAAEVEVASSGSPPPGPLDVRCVTRAAAPREVPDQRPENDARRGQVSVP